MNQDSQRVQTPTGTNQTILIVADSVVGIGDLADQLVSRGFTVQVAQGGEKGLDRARLGAPDLILLDMVMPGMDGIETCRRLKAGEQTRDIPVMFMTAPTDACDRVAVIAAGGVDAISKPLQIDAVVARIQPHLALQVVKRQLDARDTQLRQALADRATGEETLRGVVAEQDSILENAGVGIAFGKDRRVVRCNRKFATMFGYRPEELIGVSTRIFYTSDETYESVGKQIYGTAGVGETSAIDMPNQRRDGSVFWTESALTAIDSSDSGSRAIWLVHDIDERKRAELLRAMQEKTLEMIATGAAIESVLDSIVTLVESQSDGMMGSIQLLDDDGVHLRHLSAGKLPQAYARAIDNIAIGPQAASFGAAVYRRDAVLVADLLADPVWSDYRALVAPFGFRACWSTPILSRDGKALGVLSLYGRAVREPGLSDSRLIDTAVRLASIAVEHKRSEERILYMAHHDVLTGLPNRTLLKDRLDQAILYGRRYGRYVTVLFIDLDNFKLINDTLGHNAGDELLKIVARRMEQCVRRTDTVVRIGGDEFVIILFDQPTETETVAAMIDRIWTAVAQRAVLGEHPVDVTCSMGIATFPNDGDDTDTLLMNADAAMYRAKELGRNNFQFYTASMNTKVQERMMMQDGLRNAIARNEFVLQYQPQVELQTGRIIGVEALVRWQHPQWGLVPPARFIQFAEETGLIVPIGDWVLRTACKQNKAWQARGFTPTVMSVNVSARQFREKDLVKRVAYALQESGLESKYLELELTESLIMQDVDQAVATMKELNAMGVGLSIDDFGTGYSSLSALKTFPIMRLKIDQSFVRDLNTDVDDKAIAKAVISLGHKLNLKVIAEGVENEEQMTFLRDNMCDEMQGFHFSKPVSAQEMESLFVMPDKAV